MPFTCPDRMGMRARISPHMPDKSRKYLTIFFWVRHAQRALASRSQSISLWSSLFVRAWLPTAKWQFDIHPQKKKGKRLVHAFLRKVIKRRRCFHVSANVWNCQTSKVTFELDVFSTTLITEEQVPGQRFNWAKSHPVSSDGAERDFLFFGRDVQLQFTTLHFCETNCQWPLR